MSARAPPPTSSPVGTVRAAIAASLAPSPAHPASMLAARLGAMVHLDPSGFHDPRYRFALEMCTAAGDYL